MAVCNEVETLTTALSGFGVDEKSLISILGKWRPDHNKAFRNGSPFFMQDERLFERWVDHQVAQLKREFLRFKSAMVLWMMHPWERDARLLRDAVIDGPKSYNVIVEVACTRSSDQLLGARRAYHSLFDRSIEEDVADHVTTGIERKLLVALVSSYRYEGPMVKEETAKTEAKTLQTAFKSGAPMENEEVVRILSTRSKLHLKAVFKFYEELSGKNIDQDLAVDSCLKDTVQCLDAPQVHFVKVLDAAMNPGADENAKEGLTRVVVTRADIDMKEIKEEYGKKHGASLADEIGSTAKGNFKDFLHTLMARAD